jgi:PilZ domain-containing protein
MEYMPEFNSDRREYFRINDTVFVDYNLIDHVEAERLGSIIQNPLHSGVDNQGKLQLNTIQTAFTHITDQINQNDREIARALRLLDEKINIHVQILKRQNNKSNDTNPAIEVNLSGGGIAFFSAEKLDAKNILEVHIELMPSGTTIHAITNVISCNKINDAPKGTPYFLRLVFSHMSECDRNLLVKHTLSRQAEELRAAQDDDEGQS